MPWHSVLFRDAATAHDHPPELERIGQYAMCEDENIESVTHHNIAFRGSAEQDGTKRDKSCSPSLQADGSHWFNQDCKFQVCYLGAAGFMIAICKPFLPRKGSFSRVSHSHCHPTIAICACKSPEIQQLTIEIVPFRLTPPSPLVRHNANRPSLYEPQPPRTASADYQYPLKRFTKTERENCTVNASA
jgi:hypothetical protein